MSEAALMPKNVNKKNILIASLVVISSFYLRILNYKSVVSNEGIYFFDPDCYMRLRKIYVLMENFPLINIHDFYQGFPVGTGIVSPPTLEYFFAAIVLLLEKFFHVSVNIELLIALVPPLVGTLTIIILLIFLNDDFGAVPALSAAIILALAPLHIMTTTVGRFDNEMMESFCFLLVIWRYRETYRENASDLSWFQVAMASVFFLLVWRGAILPLAIIGLDVMVRMVMARQDVNKTRCLSRSAALLYLTQAIALAIICAFDLFGTRNQFAFTIISWFHCVLFVLSALFFSTLALFLRHFTETRKLLFFAILVFSSVLMSVLTFEGNGILNGVNVFSTGNPWLESIQQYSGSMAERLSISSLLINYGGALFLLPVAILLFVKRGRKGSWQSLFVCIVLVTFVAAMFRARFGHFLVIAMSLGVAIIVNFMVAGLPRFKFPKAVGSFAVAIILIAMQGWTFTRIPGPAVGFNIKGDMEETLHWLKDNTPLPGNPYMPQKKPIYGVLARWDYGGYIETLAQRPTLATNFGTETYGMEEVAHFLLADNDSDMSKVLRDNEIRYILMDKLTGDLTTYAKLIGNTESFFIEKWDPSRRVSVRYPTSETFSLVSSRLYYADGTERVTFGFTFAPVEGLRLVYESRTAANVVGFPWEIKKYKIFEFLDGATIVIDGIPGKEVVLSQWIQTNQGRRFEYKIKKFFDEKGKAVFKVVYSPLSVNDSTGSVGSCYFFSSGQILELKVNKADIDSGMVYSMTFSGK